MPQADTKVVNVTAQLKLPHRLDIIATAHANPELQVELTARNSAVVPFRGRKYILTMSNIVASGFRSEAEAHRSLTALTLQRQTIFIMKYEVIT